MIIKDFNSFKTENPNEIVFTIKDLENEVIEKGHILKADKLELIR